MEGHDLEKKEGPKMTIEAATLADLEDLKRLNGKLAVKENHEFDDTIDPAYPMSERGEAYFRSRIESPGTLSIVAKEGDVAVGYLIGALTDSEDYRTPLTMAELENMFVDEAHRGKGIGGKMAERFEGWCKENGVQRIKIVASAGNADAIRFYEALGAKPVSLTLEKKLD